MVKREFKARVVDNFKDEWVSFVMGDEGLTKDEALAAYGGAEIDRLCERISGKIVTITENHYPSIDGAVNDFFEKLDNNFVIPKELFSEV